MRQQTWLPTLALSLSGLCYATEPPCNSAHQQCGHDDGDNPSTGPLEVRVNPRMETSSDSTSTSEATAGSFSSSIAGASSFAGGSNASINYARQAPNIYLGAPGNQLDCNLIIGFSASREDGATAFGIPWPRGWAPTCDIWKAANMAQENGHIYTSYALQCTIKHIAKRFGKEACDKFRERSIIELGFTPPPITITPPLPSTTYAEDEAEWRMEQQMMYTDLREKYESLEQEQHDDSRLKGQLDRDAMRRAEARQILKGDDNGS